MQNLKLPYILTYYDAILTPVYFFLLLLIIFWWKKKRYSNSPVKKYIIPAFVLKIIGCIFLACIYNFYYSFGDLQTYYSGAHEIWNATKENPLYGLELVFKPLEKCSPKAQSFTAIMNLDYWEPQSLYVFKTAGFIGMFCFGTYLPIAMIFTLASFIGSWRIFLVFYEEYPEHHLLIALTCLFVPSALIWGTNIIKDPLCIFGLGICITGLNDLIKGRFRLVNLIEIIIGITIMRSLKEYIFYIFLVSAIVTLHRSLLLKYRNYILKNILRFLTFVIIIVGLVWCISNRDIFADLLYENFSGRTEVIQNVQASAIEEGASGYIIPNVNDFTLLGIARSYLLSLNVTLFRPYLWEVNNLLMLGNALESTAIMLFTIYLLFKSKIFGFFSFAFKKPILLFALTFTLLMAPLAGFVSFNFGTLVRYKLPVVPLFYSYLILLYIDLKKKEIVLNAKKETGDSY